MDLKDLHRGMEEGNFWLTGKRSMIDFLMKKVAGRRTDLNILNIGAGTGEDFQIISKYGALTVIDIDKDTVALMPDHLVEKKLVADACCMPFANSTFDVIVAFDLLEHIPDDHAAVSEVLRCLKSGGSFVYSVPAFNFLFSKHDELLGHVRRYDKTMVRKLLFNFDMKFFSFWLFFLFIPAAFLRLLEKYGLIGLTHSTNSALLNFIFTKIMWFENVLMRFGMRYPWGLSLIGIAQK
jgi:SAM-dependent methyltransferase